jgi:hypothetical protein
LDSETWQEWKLFVERKILGAVEILVFVCDPFVTLRLPEKKNTPNMYWWSPWIRKWKKDAK